MPRFNISPVISPASQHGSFNWKWDKHVYDLYLLILIIIEQDIFEFGHGANNTFIVNELCLSQVGAFL